MSHGRQPGLRAAALLVGAAALLLAGCSGGASGAVAWRDLTVTIPQGWQELERRDSLLMLADGPPAEEPGERGTLEIAVQFTVETNPSPDAWRALIEERGGDVESDERTELDSVPATILQYSMVTTVPTRERVVIVPSRNLVILQHPVPMRGETDAPDVFLEHADELDAILTSLDFGAPVDYRQD